MKTLTTINWSIGVLYRLFFVYTILTTVVPNSHPAGRDDRFLLLLFVFVIILVGLNLMTSRLAKMAALVLGSLPILLISANLLIRNITADQREQEDVQALQQHTLYSPKP